MKNFFLVLSMSCVLSTFSQNMEVQNMVSFVRNKELAKAKASADAAMVHESTKTSAKMWMYRGHVYKAIYNDTSAAVKKLDADAEEKALEAYINCRKYDKDNIYKEEMQGDLVKACGATKRKVSMYKQNKQYEKALACYDLLEASIAYDENGSIKRQNIATDKILYEKFEMYKAVPNKQKATEYANKLIEIKYKDPKIYLDMVKISLIDKDTATALSYIEKGKLIFDDNMDLIGTEIDIYIKQKKGSVLKDRLTKAIELAPDNEVLHVVLGQIYKKSNDLVNAEKEFAKAVQLKPEYEVANYELGALFFNTAADYNDKLNDLPPKETAKAKEYEEKVKENFKKAVPYLEKAYEITPDKAYKQRLFQAYSRLGDTEKASKYK